MCDEQRLRPAYAYSQSDQSPCLLLENSITVKLLTEHDLEFLSLEGGSSESTLVKMPHCWKSHVTAHMITLPFLWDPNIVLYRDYIALGYRNISTTIV